MQKEAGFTRTTWSNYETGLSKPGIDELNTIAKAFGVSMDDIINIDLSKEGNLTPPKEEDENTQNSKLKGKGTGNPKPLIVSIYPDTNISLMAYPGVEYATKGAIIPITDISVAAGDGHYNSEYIYNVDSLRLPASLVKKGSSYLAVNIKGISMSPTLQDGGYVIIRLLDRSEWAKMHDERIYVVCDMDGKSYLKRVKNRFKQGFIVLRSDNPDQASFPSFNLTPAEINTIWYVEWYLSAKMPNIHDQYYSRLQKLEDKVDDLTALSNRDQSKSK